MQPSRGMSLIDVVVGSALVVIIFVALFGILRASILLSSQIKSQAAATAIANNQMEYIRSLSYDSVGTVGGIPSGSIPQATTTVEDGTTYTVNTFIEYYDDPADGTGTHDSNGITTDYKKIKVSVSYGSGAQARQINLVSNDVPLGLETTTGGGTLQVLVVNSQGSPVSGATVQITDSSISPTVNLTTVSDTSGSVYLPGAQPDTNYAVSVTKSGYSTAQTYARDTNNQNPTPGYLTVVKNQTTSSTFAIDVLGTLTLETYSPVATSTFSDSFANTSELTSLTNVTVSGSLALSSGQLSGSAQSINVTPAYLNSWGQANATITSPAGSTATVQVMDQNGNLIPDSVLPGNSTGFTTFPVNLSGVSTTTYPTLALKANFTSTGSATPFIGTWSLTSSTGPTPLPNIAFTLTGAKKIGSTGAGAPIYKTIVSTSTDSTGTNIQTLEWDSYSLSVSGHDVEDACGAPPYALSPGASFLQTLTLGTATSNSMLVSVTDSSGNFLSGVSVTLARSGYSKTVPTSSCGNAYFGSLSSASDYTITIAKTGYTTTNISNVSVTGENTFYAVSF